MYNCIGAFVILIAGCSVIAVELYFSYYQNEPVKYRAA